MLRSKKREEDREYYELIAKQQREKRVGEGEKISTDFVLFLSLVWDLLFFVLMLIPNLVGFLFSLLFARKEGIKKYSEKILFEPFEIVRKILRWFFEAKVTSFLILGLIVIYGVEYYFLESYMYSLMSYPLHIFEGNYWSLVTSLFLHADLVHLLSNCLALLVFGRIVEKQVGFNTLFLFLACGVIANFVSNMIALRLDDVYYSLGASGAIAGLIMFAILFSPFSFTSIFIVPLPIFVVGWGLIALDLIGLSNPSKTNHLAHLAGYGALLVLFFFMEMKHKKKIIAGLSLNALLLVVFFILSRVVDLSFLF